MAEQRTFNPLVQGSTPWRPTCGYTLYPVLLGTVSWTDVGRTVCRHDPYPFRSRRATAERLLACQRLRREGPADRREIRFRQIDAIDSVFNAASNEPEVIASVLHGILLGPVAPTVDQRRTTKAPALVLGHGIDLIHSFKDAERLTQQLPDARLIRTRTFAERLTGEIGDFLDRVWADGEPVEPPPSLLG
jgi:hypothetical protein